MQYCIYLRKSRADAEAEARGEGETLLRHEKILLELANRQKIAIGQIYREIVSGETIAARPIMQQLLAEVEKGLWQGVLVMEIERLARGDTIDQGIMAQTFKFSDTKIITPMKTYDPNDEFDEEYFEFGLFMSRREYKTINRRLQRGRLQSVKEGKCLATIPPYGYLRQKLETEKGYSLTPHPQQADIVNLIFALYTRGQRQPDGTYRRLGISLIVRRLNELKIAALKGGQWSPSSVREILRNPVYIGKIRWNWRPNVKKMVDGQMIKQRPRSSEQDYQIFEGKHQPIISQKTWDLARLLMKQNPPVSLPEKKEIKNPLAGLIICGKCQHKMTRRPYKKAGTETLICQTAACDNISSSLKTVEARVLSALQEWLSDYKIIWDIEGKQEQNDYEKILSIKQRALKRLEEELAACSNQKNKLHDLLEQGAYDIETFRERCQIIAAKIEEAQADHSKLQKEIELDLLLGQGRPQIMPKVQKLLEIYHILPDAKSKNELLKEIVEKIVYVKTVNGRWHGQPDDFQLILYPKLPMYENH